MTDQPLVPSDVETIIRVAQEATGVAIDELPDVSGVVLATRASSTIVERLDLEPWLPMPRRTKGVSSFTQVVGFCEYTERHRNGEIELWADKTARTVTAVLNPPDPLNGRRGWGDHQAIFRATSTTDLDAWSGVHRETLGQQTFAEHLEDVAHTLIEPSSAEMLTVAQSIEGTITAEVRAARRLVEGARSSVMIETVNAKAGTAANVEIPTTFTIALALFEGTDPIRLTVRLRYRLGAGSVTFTPIIDRLDDALDAAFGQLVDQAASTLGVNAWWR